jgi:hypothetical protein
VRGKFGENQRPNEGKLIKKVRRSNMNHPSEIKIYQYINEAASKEDIYDIDRHMAECNECFERIRSLIYLKENFEDLWNTFSAEDIGHTARQMEKVKALQGSILRPVPVAAKDLISKPVNPILNLKLLFDDFRKVTALAKSYLSDGYSLFLNPIANGIGSADDTFIDNKRNQASTHLSNDDISGAIESLNEVSLLNPSAVRFSSATIVLAGEKVASIDADINMTRLQITYWVETERPNPVSVKLVSGENETVDSKKFSPADEGDILVAEFFKIPNGSFTVIFEFDV